MTSICRHCVNGRRVSSDTLQDEGWVGCTMLLDARSLDVVWESIYVVGDVELAQGWVDLRSWPEAIETKGSITNMQLVSKNVQKCTRYQKRDLQS